MRHASLAVLLVTAFASSGCKPQPITMQPGARTFTPDSYASVWKAWTRDEESFAWKELAHEIFGALACTNPVALAPEERSERTP